MPKRLAVAVAIVLDVALWAVVGRLDVAVHALLAEQQATGSWPSTGLPHEGVWYLAVVGAVGLSIALTWVVVAHNHPPEPWRFIALAGATVVTFTLWIGWDVVCVVAGGWHRAQTQHDLLSTLLAVLVVWLALKTGAMYDVTLRGAWELAPVVRLQFFLLGLLVVAAFVFPMTSGQAIDMMRAWTDAGWRLPAAALASALVLGEMMRESGIRLSRSWSDVRDLSDREWRVFRLVTIMPAGILFVGAVIAATDSLLLESISDGGVRRAVLAAAIGGVVMVCLVATVMAPRPGAEVDTPAAELDGIVPAGPTMPPGHTARPPAVDPADVWRRRALSIAGAAGGVGLGVAFALFTMWTAVLLILVTAAFVVRQWARMEFDEPTRGALPLNIAWGLSAGVGLAVYWNPIDHPRNLGMIAVAMMFAAGLLGALYLLALAAERIRKVVRDRWQRIVRVPVVIPLVAWFGFATQCAPQPQHQARIVQVRGLAIRTTLANATTHWLADEYAAVRASGGRPKYLPLLLVADSGGGSKSAYWTDLVLDCLIGGGPMEPSSRSKRECNPTSIGTATAVRRERGLFLTSSVSGGSVGIARYVSNVRDIATGARWVDRATGGDFLAPTVAWGLYHDLPDTFFGAIGSKLGIDASDPTKCGTNQDASCRYNLDRAAIEEAAIAGRPWDRAPSARTSVDALWQRSLAATDPQHITPLTVFNTAVSGGKGRVLVSPVDLAPLTVLDDQCPAVPQQPGESVVDAIDAADLYSKYRRGTPASDVDITTAGLLSGRFPVVDPVARLGNRTSVKRAGSAPPCLDPTVTTLPAQFVRDGGYVENTGLLTIVQALPAISRAAADWTAAGSHNPPVVIWVLSIDDDAAFINGRVKPGVQRPTPVSLGTRASDQTLTEVATESLTIHQGGVSCYGRISPVPGVGARAATGWLLSKTVRNYDLAASLANQSRVTILDEVQKFLQGEGSECLPPLQ